MTEKKKLHFMKKFGLSLIKPLKVLGSFFVMMIGVTIPVYVAQIYESNIYISGAGHLTKVQASHYSNMISFAYQLAAIVTAIFGYYLVRKFWKILKEPSALKVYYQEHPQEAPDKKYSFKETLKKTANIDAYKEVGKKAKELKEKRQAKSSKNKTTHK